jgi:hypothetical protein
MEWLDVQALNSSPSTEKFKKRKKTIILSEKQKTTKSDTI